MRFAKIQKGLKCLAIITSMLVICLFFSKTDALALTRSDAKSVSSKQDSCAKMSFEGTINYDYINKVHRLVNSERKKKGLKALVLDKNLTKAAIQRAYEAAMCFSHTRPNGKRCFSVIENEYGAAGENIAAGYTTSANVMKGWMNSPGHRENILRKNYSTIGIAAVKINGRYYWVQLFIDGKAQSYSKTGTTKSTKTVDVLPSYMDYSVRVDTSMKVGEKQTLKFYNNVIKVSIKGVKYKASSKAITISGSTIKAVKAGKAKITLSFGKTTYKIATVTVKAKSITEIKPVITLSASSKKITVRWKKVSGANGYVVYRATKKNGTYKKIATITKSSKLSYSNSGLKSKKRYYYRVRAYKKVNGKKVYSKYSVVISAKTK